MKALGCNLVGLPCVLIDPGHFNPAPPDLIVSVKNAKRVLRLSRELWGLLLTRPDLCPARPLRRCNSFLPRCRHRPLRPESFVPAHVGLPEGSQGSRDALEFILKALRSFWSCFTTDCISVFAMKQSWHCRFLD
jgi:hypothetical protein